MIYHCLRVACLLSLAYICDSFIIDRSMPRNHIYRTDDRAITSIQLSAYFNKRSDSSGRNVKADEDARLAEGRRISNEVQKAAAPKSLAQKNILGQNIINCRQFSLDSTKVFDFVGSFKSLNSIPIYSIPEIAFIGRSNVGKSSLLNCLTGQNKKVAIESKTPGRTQSINMFNCKDSKAGDICLFVDLPGYGYAKISKEMQEEISQFIRDYLLARGALKLVLLLVDPRRDALQSDVEMLDYLEETGVTVVVVATKIDKLRPGEVGSAMDRMQTAYGARGHQVIPFSALTGHGKKDLWRAIRDNLLTAEEEEEEDNGAEDEN